MTEQQVVSQFLIPSENMDSLEERLESLNRRAKRLHTAPIVLSRLGTETKKDEAGFPVVFYQVQVSGESPIINGWVFVATLEHTYDDQGETHNVIHAVPGLVSDLSSYRDIDPQCDHCHTKRLRIDTYLLRNEAGDIKQVGKTCLKDFTGHSDPLDIAAAAELLALAGEAATSCADDDFLGGGGKSSVTDLEYYLGWVHACMRTWGWVSRVVARESWDNKVATADAALDAMIAFRKNPYSVAIKPEEKDREESKRALAWIHSLTDTSNDYLYNLSVVCKGSVLSFRNIGLAASLFAAYHKAEERAHAHIHASLTSELPGEVGKRSDFTLTCNAVVYSEGTYGMTAIYKLSDAKGNQFTWFSSRDVLDVHETYSLKATVKGRSEYQGIKQTVITRCKVQEK